jgi:hypothetical protein
METTKCVGNLPHHFAQVPQQASNAYVLYLFCVQCGEVRKHELPKLPLSEVRGEE